jgi:hypothetical protein
MNYYRLPILKPRHWCTWKKESFSHRTKTLFRRILYRIQYPDITFHEVFYIYIYIVSFTTFLVASSISLQRQMVSRMITKCRLRNCMERNARTEEEHEWFVLKCSVCLPRYEQITSSVQVRSLQLEPPRFYGNRCMRGHHLLFLLQISNWKANLLHYQLGSKT